MVATQNVDLDIRARLTKVERLLAYALIAITLILLFVKLRSLFYLPVYDSYLWWGDESWLMLEFKEQMLHGILRHPLAYGASIHVGNGMLLGSHWLSALLYGLPQVLIRERSDPVTIGRCVTAMISILLVASTYNVLRRFGVTELLSALGLLIIVTTRTFVLTSHSARYDILTALVLLWFFFIATKKLSDDKLHPMLYGLMLPSLLLVSTHALLLGSGLWLYGIVRRHWWKEPKTIGLTVTGMAIGAVAVVIAAFATGQAHQLIVSRNGTGFLRNISDIPILRPFSRSVQVANVLQRWQQVVELSPFVLGVVVLSGMTWLTNALRRGAKRSWRMTPTTTGAVIISLFWLFGESAAPTSYLIYVVPIVIIATLMSLQRYAVSVRTTTALSASVFMLLFIAGAALSAADYGNSETAANTGLTLSEHNVLAVDSAAAMIMHDPHTTGKTLIENPAVAEMLSVKNASSPGLSARLDLMTTQLVEYPAGDLRLDSSLRREGVQYMMLYASQLNPDFMQEAAPLRSIAATRGELLHAWVAPMTDIGRSYSTPIDTSHPDSLLLFRLKP